MRDQLQQRFLSYPHPNANHVSVVPSSDPQLVVVRGLLLDQQQRWETGGAASVLATRVARASYGFVVKELYSPERHYDEEVRVDAFDRTQRWALHQIQWLIRKGDVVNPNVPVVKSFEIRLGPGETTRAWDSQIVISQNEASFLPRSMKHGEIVVRAGPMRHAQILTGRGSRRDQALRRAEQSCRCAAASARPEEQARHLLQRWVHLLPLPV